MQENYQFTRMKEFVGHFDGFVIELSNVGVNVPDPLFQNFPIFAMNHARARPIHCPNFEGIRPNP